MADHLPKDIRATLQKLKNRASKDDRKLLQKLDVQLAAMVPSDNGDGVMHVESGVSIATKNPFVTFQWGTMKGQLNPIEARGYAMQILESCEASIQDAAMFRGFIELGQSEEQAASMIALVRENRRKFEETDGK